MHSRHPTLPLPPTPPKKNQIFFFHLVTVVRSAWWEDIPKEQRQALSHLQGAWLIVETALVAQLNCLQLCFQGWLAQCLRCLTSSSGYDSGVPIQICSWLSALAVQIWSINIHTDDSSRVYSVIIREKSYVKMILFFLSQFVKMSTKPQKIRNAALLFPYLFNIIHVSHSTWAHFFSVNGRLSI